MTDIEKWAIHAISHYDGQPLAVIPPEPAAGTFNLVISALRKLESDGIITRVEYKGASWYELRKPKKRADLAAENARLQAQVKALSKLVEVMRDAMPAYTALLERHTDIVDAWAEANKAIRDE